MLQKAFQAYQSGNAAEAESISRQVLAAHPDHEGGLLLLAMSLDAQRKGAEAIALFERMTLLFPNTSAYWTNLGTVRRSLGHDDLAVTAFERALALAPDDANALFNLGSFRFDKGDYVESRALLLKAHAQAPDDAGIRVQAAGACFECGDIDGAERLLDDWERWIPDDVTLLTDIGWTLTRLTRADEAGRALEAAARAMPGNTRVDLRRAAFYERTNRVDEATALLARIPQDAIDRVGLRTDAATLRADLAARGNDLATARRLYEELVADAAMVRRDPQLPSQLARVCDRLGDADAAIDWLARGRALHIAQLRERAPQVFEEGADPLRIIRRRITSAERASWRSVPAPGAHESPVFVVGFPRSGTTMLETMLDAHPALAGMDERAFVQDVIDAMGKGGRTYPDDLGQLDDAECAALRALYVELAATRARVPVGQRIVDKNPLNIMRLPMIARLFPEARIILALRHPCDVVLSNYMQTFRSPAYVALTATIESTARGYADTFAFWLDQVAVLAPNVLELRYEDVVDDIEAQSRRIADFVGVDWDARMVNFHERAKERGFIATPSYHQVVEPINRKGVARWERYRRHLEPAIPLLQPYIERWNYTV